MAIAHRFGRSGDFPFDCSAKATSKVSHDKSLQFLGLRPRRAPEAVGRALKLDGQAERAKWEDRRAGPMTIDHTRVREADVAQHVIADIRKPSRSAAPGGGPIGRHQQPSNSEHDSLDESRPNVADVA